MKRTTVNAGMRAGARGLLAAAGTLALVRVGYHFRRTLMLVALAAISDLLLASDARGGHRGWLGALPPGR
jgi:hypothetical protein